MMNDKIIMNMFVEFLEKLEDISNNIEELTNSVDKLSNIIEEETK